MTYHLMMATGRILPPGTVIPHAMFPQVVIVCKCGEKVVGVLVWDGERWNFQESA